MALKDIPDSRLLKILRWLPILILIIIVPLFLATFWRLWFFDIYVSGLPQILIITSGLYLLLAAFYLRFIIRDGWDQCLRIVGKADVSILLVGILLTLFLAVYSQQIINPLDLSRQNGESLKIGTYNKLYSNDDTLSGINYFISQRSDLVGLQEIQPSELELFRKGLGLEYSFVTDCDCSAEDTEIGLVSRFPIIEAYTIYEYANGGIIRAEIGVDQSSSLVVYVVHLTPPLSNSFYQRRQKAFDILTNALSEEDQEVVVMGDFNTTIYSPDLRDLLADTKDQLNYVVTNSFPRCSWFGFGDIACLRIDHIFAPKTTSLRDFQIGNNVGSDHRPLMAEITFD